MVELILVLVYVQSSCMYLGAGLMMLQWTSTIALALLYAVQEYILHPSWLRNEVLGDLPRMTLMP